MSEKWYQKNVNIAQQTALSSKCLSPSKKTWMQASVRDPKRCSGILIHSDPLITATKTIWTVDQMVNVEAEPHRRWDDFIQRRAAPSLHYDVVKFQQGTSVAGFGIRGRCGTCILQDQIFYSIMGINGATYVAGQMSRFTGRKWRLFNLISQTHSM